MKSEKIIKIGAICIIGYVGFKVVNGILYRIAKSINGKKELEREQKQLEERMKKLDEYDEIGDLDSLMDAVFHM